MTRSISMQICTSATVVLAISVVLTNDLRSDWRVFRGEGGVGSSEETGVPQAWGPSKNIAWKVRLPGRGISSPVVVGDRVFLTASAGYRQDRLFVLAFDTTTGERLWERRFFATGDTVCHPKSCNAAPTGVSDGKRLYCFFSSNDVVCLDLDGDLQWLRGITHDYPNASNSVGMSSSLLIAGETLVAQVENDSNSFTVGLDAATGVNRWKIARPARVNWSSPVLLREEDSETVILQSIPKVSGHDPASGRELWKFEASCGAIASCTVADGVIYVPAEGITALRIGKEQKPEVLWSERRLRVDTPSPAIHHERIYTLGRGILHAADAITGELRWQLRLKGPFSSSPVVCGGHLYAFNEEGLGQVVRLGDEDGEVTGEYSLGEKILCTPALSDGALYVRSDGHLWKIAKR